MSNTPAGWTNALGKERTEREERANFKKRIEDLENRVTALENQKPAEPPPAPPEPSAADLDAAELERKIAQDTAYLGPNRRVDSSTSTAGETRIIDHPERREFPGYSGE